MEVVRKIALGHDSLVGPAGLEPAASSTPSSTAWSLRSLDILASPVCSDFRGSCPPGGSGLTGAHGLNGSYAEWCPTGIPPGGGGALIG